LSILSTIPLLQGAVHKLNYDQTGFGNQDDKFWHYYVIAKVPDMSLGRVILHPATSKGKRSLYKFFVCRLITDLGKQIGKDRDSFVHLYRPISIKPKVVQNAEFLGLLRSDILYGFLAAKENYIRIKNSGVQNAAVS